MSNATNIDETDANNETIEYELNNIKLKIPKNSQLTIATHNVRGINKKTKQFSIINEYKTLNLDIIGLSETNLNANDAKHFSHHNSAHYRYYFSKTRNQMIGSGVGLLIKEEIAKYVYKHNSFEDRIVYVDLNMKGKSRLRIIQTYMPANPTQYPERIKLNRELKRLILEAENNNSKIIIMGDFNADPKYTNKEGSRYHNSCKFYKYLEDMDFLDMINVCHDVNETTP